MIWDKDISFEGFQKRIDDWYKGDVFLGDPPIDAQFALDLSYLTSMPESVEQTNCIMLELILWKYSRKYRKWVKQNEKRK